MSLELPTDLRDAAIASIERYCREHLDEPIGNVAAGGLLRFFLAEIGPLLYNRGVADTQAHLQLRIADADIDVHEEPFRFWTQGGPRSGGRR